jgi:excisionase family DNA binding protein
MIGRMADEVEDDLLTLPEIAEMLRMNPSTVRLWVREKRLPAHKAGGRKWLVRRADLKQMLDAQPHVGHPHGAAVSAERKDWSQIPEQAALDIASSTGVQRGDL